MYIMHYMYIMQSSYKARLTSKTIVITPKQRVMQQVSGGSRGGSMGSTDPPPPPPFEVID